MSVAATADDEVRQLGDRLIDAVSTPFRLQDQDVQIGGSIGIALDSTGHSLIDSVVRDADTALYRAKHSGGGRVEIFELSPFVPAHPRDRLRLIS